MNPFACEWRWIIVNNGNGIWGLDCIDRGWLHLTNLSVNLLCNGRLLASDMHRTCFWPKAGSKPHTSNLMILHACDKFQCFNYKIPKRKRIPLAFHNTRVRGVTWARQQRVKFGRRVASLRKYLAIQNIYKPTNSYTHATNLNPCSAGGFDFEHYSWIHREMLALSAPHDST